eukprot:g8084.t1
METEFSKRSPERMISFEIEQRKRSRSRDSDFFSSETFWDAKNSRVVFRWNPLRRGMTESEVNNKHKVIHEQFQNDVAEARLDDVTDLEMLDFIRFGTEDKEGRETLIFIAKHIPNELIKQERVQRFILHKIETAGQRVFNVLYIHTNSSVWSQHQGLKIMWNLFCRLPKLYRDRLYRFYILHPDIYVQFTIWLVLRWFMFQLWMKIHYLSRVEDMDHFFPNGDANFPSFVEEYDRELNKHPLMSYGFCTFSEVDSTSSGSGPVFYT